MVMCVCVCVFVPGCACTCMCAMWWRLGGWYVCYLDGILYAWQKGLGYYLGWSVMMTVFGINLCLL